MSGCVSSCLLDKLIAGCIQVMLPFGLFRKCCTTLDINTCFLGRAYVTPAALLATLAFFAASASLVTASVDALRLPS
eukprot:14323037-Ditylum_brightwellii.AAC.1